jgi:hypothetical protein
MCGSAVLLFRLIRELSNRVTSPWFVCVAMFLFGRGGFFLRWNEVDGHQLQNFKHCVYLTFAVLCFAIFCVYLLAVKYIHLLHPHLV